MPAPSCCRDFQQRMIELPVGGQQTVDVRAVVFVQQVGLVQQQQRPNTGMLGSNQVAVDQVGVWIRQRGEHDDDLIDVGLQPA